MKNDHDTSRIRPLEAGDLPALRRVIDATGLFPSKMLNGMAAGHLAGGSSPETWLVHDHGGPVALAYAAPERMTDGTSNLLLIAVDPALQGGGIGRGLMDRMERLLAADGTRMLLVETSGLPGFAATRRFYAGLGYGEEARIRDFYQAGEDKVVFRKLLPG